MTGIFDWLFAFVGRVLAVPELHAIVLAVGCGFAVCYLFSRKLPAVWAIQRAIKWQRVIIFFVVFGVAVKMVTTPVMAGWAFMQAVFTPLFYEWLTAIIFHRWPWLKPQALLTAPEMQARVADKESP